MSKEIRLPAGYAPAFALGISDSSGNYVAVDDTTPLPVEVRRATPGSGAALTGSTSANVEIGPFAPVLDVPIVIVLEGQWSGLVRLLRSKDGGVTRQPLTVAGNPWAVYGSNVCEQAWVESEKDVVFFLDVALDSGTVAYRIAQ